MVLTINNPEIAARGIASGLKTTCNPQHWGDAGMGLLKSFVLLADEDGRQDSLANSCLASAVLGTQDSFLKECDDYAKHSEVQMQAIRQEFHETSEKLKKMSDEELIECVFSFGTTFFLDGVILKAGTLAATVEGRALLNQCAEALNSPFAKEYVLEAVGVGKLTLEEGADIANMAIEVVEKNPQIIQAGDNIAPTIRTVATIEQKSHWESLAHDPAHGNAISSKSIEEALAGIAAEEKGFLPGPIKRDPSGSAEFIDALERAWDVKTPISVAPNGKRVFKLDQIFDSIKRELGTGENVILNMVRLDEEDALSLISKLKTELTPDEIKKIITVLKKDLF